MLCLIICRYILYVEQVEGTLQQVLIVYLHVSSSGL